MLPELVAALETTYRRGEYVVVTRCGKPFSPTTSPMPSFTRARQSSAN